MTKIRVFAKRPAPLNLPDSDLVVIDPSTVPFEIGLYQQVDEQEPTLVSSHTFDVSKPTTPVCGAHSHWDGEKCVCDPEYHDENGECVADAILPPSDKVLYDSNKDGGWNNGKARTVGKGGSDGNIKANGKGIFTAASGNPQVAIDGKGVGTLKTQPGFGRFYLCVNNFNAELDFDFMIKSSSVKNMSIKARCRHQSGGSPDNKFGGLGNATSLTETDFKIELYHNVHDKGYNQKLSPKLELNKWYHKKYVYHNTPDNKAIKMEDWIGGEGGKDLKKVFERTETKPIAAAMNKAKFMEESWVWFRLNGDGEIAFKNVKITAL